MGVRLVRPRGRSGRKQPEVRRGCTKAWLDMTTCLVPGGWRTSGDTGSSAGRLSIDVVTAAATCGVRVAGRCRPFGFEANGNLRMSH